ncbi:MAG: L-2-hydroxyglutarate oxidase [Rhodobacteraceae bacterium]|nr:L-2-hydroxyglutarate oxidase [Paracoccaceae bacterium]
MKKTYDYVVIGGGIIGIATAVELQARMQGASVAVLEKEAELAIHQTGHNSGVIHAGVYYAPGSMKARFCREGVTATRAFCDEFDIPYKICGKLIVATSEAELERMAALKDRALKNGIEIEDVSQEQLHQLEPHISGVGGLMSPTTGIVNFALIAQTMAQQFENNGGTILRNCSVLKGEEHSSSVTLNTNLGSFEAGQVVVCAGLHSDRMIKAFGHTPDFQVIPFRGEYFRLKNQPDDLVRHLIYPVPDPERPFLGVHLTQKMDGGFTVGPNAVLALKREGYGWGDISLTDTFESISYPGFWRMLAKNIGPALSEIQSSVSKRHYLKKVRRYCKRINLQDLTHYPAGVRAQAVGRDGRIIDDFLFVRTERCLHVGNAPSPAATSAIPISRHIVDSLCQ